MSEVERDFMEVRFAPGRWGVVRHIPGSYPEWLGEACWAEGTARILARNRARAERRAAILRRPPGTRFYAVHGRSVGETILQFDRIMRGVVTPDNT